MNEFTPPPPLRTTKIAPRISFKEITEMAIKVTHIGDVRISTVKLKGENLGGNFETMIFGMFGDDRQWRSLTVEGALFDHEAACREVEEGLRNDAE